MAAVAVLVWFLFRPQGVVVPADLSGKSVLSAAQELSGIGVPVHDILTCGSGSAGYELRAGGRAGARLGQQYYLRLGYPPGALCHPQHLPHGVYKVFPTATP